MLAKEEIIKHLQLLTAENGGETPSEKNFYQYTEVKITDRRKYWSNYGELVIEAGLTPNKFDKTKFTQEELCTMFVGVLRDRGKWPTRGVLDVKHHNDPSFPDSSTFYKKLGLTGDLAQNILSFVEDKEDYSDVVDVCKSTLAKFQATNEDSDLVSGYVYLFKGQLRQYKIGETDNVERRLYELTKGPAPLVEVHRIKTDDRKGIERYWHSRFKDKRMKGEWFKLTLSDVKAFKRMRDLI
jgi:hypothetical protein